MALFSWRGLTALSSLLYTFLIIVTIPLAFDVGGEDCGIAFTGTLSLFYLTLSTLRIMARNTKFKYLMSTLYHLQQIIIPSLLILHLSLFSKPTETAKTSLIPLSTSDDPILKLWLSLLEPWRWFVKNATPLFTTMEGFCTLLVIQTSGRLATWLVRKRSDSWIIPQLLFSSCVFSSSLYFLYRIYIFPVTISLASATLIGAVLTVSVFLALFGIVSGRGNSVESSLLLSYIVYCLYFTFTDFQSSFSAETFLYFFSSSTRPDMPPLPPVIIDGYTNLVSNIASLVPTAFKTVFQFLHGAVSTVTPSVFVSLFYRLAVFWAATRIIPAVHQVSVQVLSRSQSFASLPSSPISSSSSSSNIPINSTKNIPGNSRLRRICSQTTNNISAKTSSKRSVSAGATVASTETPSANGYHYSEIQHNTLRQRRQPNQDVDGNSNDGHPVATTPLNSHHFKSYSDDSAIIDDSDREFDMLASTKSAMSSSTTIASNPEVLNSTSFPRTNSSIISLSNEKPNDIYDHECTDENFDDLKEKYIPYTFHDHYHLKNDTQHISKDDDYDEDDVDGYDYEYNAYMNDNYDEFTKKNIHDQTHADSDDTLYYNGPKFSSTPTTNKSNGITIQLLIIAYGPCILIAVYTHLLIQHLAIFNTMPSEHGSSIRDGKVGGSGNGTVASEFEESVIAVTSQTVVAFASSNLGRAARSSLAAYGASLSTITSAGKNAIETASATISASAFPSSFAGNDSVTHKVTWAASKAILIKNALNEIWQWSRSWVSTPRDSWQFWGWINMFSTLALYAIELIYGKQGANEDIIEYHWKSD